MIRRGDLHGRPRGWERGPVPCCERDEKVNLHKGAIFPLKEYYNALVEYKYARKSVPDHRANSGIGKATALGLARTGATVVMVCRDRLRGEEAQQEINRR